MNLTPEIRIHPDNGEKIYFYSMAQFEYLRNRHSHHEIVARVKRSNPYEPPSNTGHRRERYGNNA